MPPIRLDVQEDATLVGFLIPILILLIALHWFLPFVGLTDFLRFYPIIVAMAALAIFAPYGIHVYLTLREVLCRHDLRFKNFAYNVLFGIGAFLGSHLLFLWVNSNPEDLIKLIPAEYLLLGSYLLLTSFRLFFHSFLVAYLLAKTCNNDFEQPNFVNLSEWNEPFQSPMMIFSFFCFLYLFPMVEFFLETNYWPAVKHSNVWSLGGLIPGLEEICPTDHGEEMADGKSFSIVGIPLTLMLLPVYGLFFYLAGLKLPTLLISKRGWVNSPSTHGFRTQALYRRLQRIKTILEYLLLLSTQLILLNPISLLLSAIAWPIWKSCFSKHHCWKIRVDYSHSEEDSTEMIPLQVNPNKTATAAKKQSENIEHKNAGKTSNKKEKHEITEQQDKSNKNN